nr:exopolysaccharide biosynthesis polyprenyl glycosylphosphotransferase [uncultured Roseococcus sp.]
MTSLFNHTVRSEMLALYLAETAAIALAVFALVMGVLPFDEAGPSIAAAAGFAVLVSLLAGFAAGAIGLYRPVALQGFFPSVARGVTGSGLLALLVAGFLGVLPFGFPPHSFLPLMSAALLGSLASMALLRFAFGLFQFPLPRVALVGRAADPEALQKHYRPFEVTLALPAGEALIDAVERGRLRAWRIWAVVAAVQAPLAPATRRRCGVEGLQVFTESEFSEKGLNRIDIERLPDGWLASANALRESLWSRGLRRAFDILLSLALLTLTLPLLLVTMLAIRLDGPGPIFYRQERVGLGNRRFNLLKFRSMVPNAEVKGAPVWATQGDSRVTRVGYFLRLCRIDEIPQVMNVLRGDMSFIGPRPERPRFVEQLGQVIPHYHDRAVVRPGITGWAQVNYPYGASVEDARMKLSYDLYYIRRRSFFLDLLILLATVRVVLFQEGAR